MSEQRPTLFVCSELDLGGAERHWGALLPALRDRGRPVRLVAVKRGGLIYDRLRDQGIPTTILGGAGGPLSLARFHGLWGEQAHRPTGVMTWGFDADLMGALFARIARIPQTVAWHAGPGSTISRRQRLAARLTALSGATAVAVANAQRSELDSLGFGPGRIWVGPPGVAAPETSFESRADARRALGLPERSFIAVLVGRVVPEKRIDRFLDAFRTLAGRGRDAHGVVVGDGPERDRLEQNAAADSCPVVFAGYSERPGDFMLAADVVCLTSDREGLPLTLLEAAASGRPSVVMDVGGVTDVVADQRTGLVVPAGDVPAFADALERLADDPDLARRLGEQANSRWRTDLSADAMADAYHEMLNRLAKGRGGAAR